MKRRTFVNGRQGNYICPDNYPVAYINMPKCSCTTIKNYLYFIDNNEWYPDPCGIHKALSRIEKQHYTNDTSNIFTFTFVRNPLKRAFSAFNEKIINLGKYSFVRINRYISEIYNIDLSPSSNPVVVEKQFYTFLCFIDDNLNNKTNVRKDWHWLPQYLVLKKNVGSGIVDFIGRTEMFKQDFAFVMNKAGIEEIDVTLRFNEGPKPNCRLEDICSHRILAKAKTVFEKDIMAFGYDLDHILK